MTAPVGEYAGLGRHVQFMADASRQFAAVSERGATKIKLENISRDPFSDPHSIFSDCYEPSSAGDTRSVYGGSAGDDHPLSDLNARGNCDE